MPETCTAPDCPLDSESDDSLCVVHTRRNGKGRQELLAAFEALEEHGVIRIHGAYLRDADLRGVNLSLKNLRDSELTGVNFDDARFDRVGFDGSCVNGASFERAIFQRCDLRGVTGLKGCRWYETIFDGVRLRGFHRDLLQCSYLDEEPPNREKAQYVFGSFKEVYKREGNQDAAGLFYEREMDMKRQLSQGMNALWYTALWILCGYGERPIRTVGVFMFSIFAYAGIYTRLSLHGPDGPITGNFLEALYFSTITFTTLGYGDIRPEGVAKLVAGSEALVGLFTVSLFIFVFCRRMVR